MDGIRKEDWHGKMTAKAAMKLGYITKEEFAAIKKRWKELQNQ